MIELDYEELDLAAHALSKMIVDHVSSAHRFLSATAYSQFHAVAYKNAFAFVSADVPCPIHISSELFKVVLKNSTIPYLQYLTPAQSTSTLDEDVANTIKLLDFTPYGPENEEATSNPMERFQRVKNELNRCKEAVANRDDYYVQHLFDNTLSMEADKHNAQVFEKYFKQLQHGDAVHQVCPEELKDYVRNLVDLASEQQKIFGKNSNLKTSIEQRRANTMANSEEQPSITVNASNNF